MKNTVIKTVVLLLWLGYIAFLFWLLFKPISQEQSKLLVGLWLKYFSSLPFEIDKAVHFCLFAPLPLLTYLSSAFMKMKFKLLFTSLFSFLLAFFTEIVQSFLPYRSYDLYDLVADTLGIGVCLLAIIIFLIADKLVNGHRNHPSNVVPKKS